MRGLREEHDTSGADLSCLFPFGRSWKRNPKRPMPRYSIIQMVKVKDKKRSLKAAREREREREREIGRASCRERVSSPV